MRWPDFVKAIVAASVSAKTMPGQQAAAPSLAPAAPPPTPPPAPMAPGPVPSMRGLMEVKPLSMTPLVPDAVAQNNAHFFSDRQMATLRRLSEILLPLINGYPGALGAATPEFLDFLIGASAPDRQQMYQSGLDRLDAQARQHFVTSFAALVKEQADQLLRPWLRSWMTDNPPQEPYAHFINVAHGDIRTATVNSQAWSEAPSAARQRELNEGLYWFPIEPDIHRESFAREGPAPTRLPLPIDDTPSLGGRGP